MIKKYKLLFKGFNLNRRFAHERTLSQTGFTLVEIITAAVIMAVTIGGIFSVFTSGNRFVLRASRRLAAVNLAQQEIENRRVEVRADMWGGAANQLPNLNGLRRTTGPAPPGLAGEWTDWSVTPSTFQPTSFRYRVDLDDHFFNPATAAIQDEGCRKVYMQVRWLEPQ